MIRFYNGPVLSLREGLELKNEEVWVKEGKICYTGKTPEELPEFEREIDLEGKLLMPGFKNCHTHSPMSAFRSYADGLELGDWLFGKILPLEEKLTPQNIYTFTKLSILEYLSSGVTSIFDMYFHLDGFVSACTECGMRASICGAITQDAPDYSRVLREYEKYNNVSELISYNLGFHAEYTANRELMEYIGELSHSFRAPVFTHMSETKSEVEGCRERHGLTPPALFESLGLFDHGGGVFHGVWLSDEDMDILKKQNVSVVSCPCSNLKLRSGIAPLARLKQKGVRICLGTDGPASNNALDIFKEMYLASLLSDLNQKGIPVIEAEDILLAATKNGAELVFPDSDCIAVGKRADLVLIDMNRPSMQPEHNIVKNLVYSGSKDCVCMTMIDGKILYENGEFFIGESPQEIYERAKHELKEITQ